MRVHIVYSPADGMLTEFVGSVLPRVASYGQAAACTVELVVRAIALPASKTNAVAAVNDNLTPRADAVYKFFLYCASLTLAEVRDVSLKVFTCFFFMDFLVLTVLLLLLYHAGVSMLVFFQTFCVEHHLSTSIDNTTTNGSFRDCLLLFS